MQIGLDDKDDVDASVIAKSVDDDCDQTQLDLLKDLNRQSSQDVRNEAVFNNVQSIFEEIK